MPHQPDRTPEAGQIHEHDLAVPVSVRGDRATRTDRTILGADDLDTQPSRPVAHTQHRDVGQADKERAHARKIGLQQGLLETRRRKTPLRIAEPLCRVRDP